MRIIIIGGGPAAVEAALRAREVDKLSQIIIFSAEKILPYRRPLLVKMLSQSFSENRFFLHNKNFYDQHRIEIRLNSEVAFIDWSEKRIGLANHTFESYDRLILATGGISRQIPQRGSGKSVFSLHDQSDLPNLQQRLPEIENCLIIGGGVLGLEIMQEMLNQNLKVTVIEGTDHLLKGVVDKECADFIQKQLLKQDKLTILTGSRVKLLENGSDYVRCHLESGITRTISGNIAINAAGIIPRQLSWLPAVKTNSLEVDEYMKVKGFDDIFAAGDCAYFPGLRSGSYMNAVYMGRLAGTNLLGTAEAITVQPPELRSSFANIKLYCAGITNDDSLAAATSSKNNSLRKLYYRNDQLVGCTLINDLGGAGEFYQLICK